MENYIRYKGKGEHSVNELEKIIEQREEELHLIRSNQAVLPQADVSSSYIADCLLQDSCLRFKQKGCDKECKLYM